MSPQTQRSVHLPTLIADLGLAASRSDARRALAVGEVEINDMVTTDQDTFVEPGDTIRVGRRAQSVSNWKHLHDVV